MQISFASGIVIAIAFGIIAWLLVERHQNRKALQRVEEKAEFLSRELAHRIKNLFSVALSIGALSKRDGATPETAFAMAQDRIRALAKAHDIAYADEARSGFDLSALVTKMLHPYQSPTNDHTRVTIRGAAFDLPLGTVTPFALILHELAGRSATHGALANPDGRLDISWDITPEYLQMDWHEIMTSTQNKETQSATGVSDRILQSSTSQLGGTLDNDPHSGITRISIPLSRLT